MSVADAPTLLVLDDADDAPLSIGDDPSLLAAPLSARA